MADFKQVVSDFLCNINKEITLLRKTTEESLGIGANVKEVNISIPEDGGSIELQSGNNIIDFGSGSLTIANGEVIQLEDSLSKHSREFMHSFAISADQQIRYRIEGSTRRIINAYHSDHVNNISFRSVIVSCDRSTNVQLRASTNSHPDMGQSINYKIDSSGRAYTVPVGSLGRAFAQCEADRLLNLDIYQCKLQLSPSERGAKVGYQSGITTTAFVVLANADFTHPTDDMQMEVVSSNAADDEGSTGAELVRITYFNKAWTKKTTDVIMDGTTIVNTTATDMYRVETFEIIKGKPAIGTITLKDTTGVTLYGQIQPLTTFMERAMHYIETGKRCVITDILIGCGTNGGIVFRLFKSDKVGDNIVTKGRMSVELADSAFPVAQNLPVVLENPEGDRFAVGIGVKAIVANQRTAATIRYYEEDI